MSIKLDRMIEKFNRHTAKTDKRIAFLEAENSEKTLILNWQGEQLKSGMKDVLERMTHASKEYEFQVEPTIEEKIIEGLQK